MIYTIFRRCSRALVFLLVVFALLNLFFDNIAGGAIYLLIILCIIPVVLFLLSKEKWANIAAITLLDTVWIGIWAAFISSYSPAGGAVPFLFYVAIFCASCFFYGAGVDSAYVLLTRWGFGRSYLSLRNVLVGFAQVLLITMQVNFIEGSNVPIVTLPLMDYVGLSFNEVLLRSVTTGTGALYAAYFILVIVHLPIFFMQVRNPLTQGTNKAFEWLAVKLSGEKYFRYIFAYVLIDIVFLSLLGCILFIFSNYLFGAVWLFVLGFYNVLCLCAAFAEISKIEEEQLRAHHESGLLLRL